MTRTPEHSPAYWAAKGVPYDCTNHIGGFNSDAVWPMYSFDRPAGFVWNTIAALLNKQGWSDDEIRVWLQSKEPRSALDGELGYALERAVRRWVKGNITEATRKQVQGLAHEEQTGKAEFVLDEEITRVTEHLAKIDPTGESKSGTAAIYRKMRADLIALKEKV